MASGLSAGAGTAIGSIGGALLGLIGSNASAHSANAHSRKRMLEAAALNYQYSKASALNTPSWNRQGLEKAGYNPMLAVQNSTSGANSSWATSSQGVGADYASGITAGESIAQNLQHLKNETAQTDSSVDLNNATAFKTRMEGIAQRLKNPFVSQREKSEIANIEKDTSKKESEINNIDTTTRFIEKNYELQKMLGLMGINVQRYGIDKNFASSIYNADSKFASDIYGIDVSHPFSKDYVGTLYDDEEVRKALYNSIRRNSYRNNPKYH